MDFVTTILYTSGGQVKAKRSKAKTNSNGLNDKVVSRLTKAHQRLVKLLIDYHNNSSLQVTIGAFISLDDLGLNHPRNEVIIRVIEHLNNLGWTETHFERSTNSFYGQLCLKAAWKGFKRAVIRRKPDIVAIDGVYMVLDNLGDYNLLQQ